MAASVPVKMYPQFMVAPPGTSPGSFGQGCISTDGKLLLYSTTTNLFVVDLATGASRIIPQTFPNINSFAQNKYGTASSLYAKIAVTMPTLGNPRWGTHSVIACKGSLNNFQVLAYTPLLGNPFSTFASNQSSVGLDFTYLGMSPVVTFVNGLIYEVTNYKIEHLPGLNEFATDGFIFGKMVLVGYPGASIFNGDYLITGTLFGPLIKWNSHIVADDAEDHLKWTGAGIRNASGSILNDKIYPLSYKQINNPTTGADLTAQYSVCVGIGTLSISYWEFTSNPVLADDGSPAIPQVNPIPIGLSQDIWLQGQSLLNTGVGAGDLRLIGTLSSPIRFIPTLMNDGVYAAAATWPNTNQPQLANYPDPWTAPWFAVYAVGASDLVPHLFKGGSGIYFTPITPTSPSAINPTLYPSVRFINQNPIMLWVDKGGTVNGIYQATDNSFWLASAGLFFQTLASLNNWSRLVRTGSTTATAGA